MHAYTDRLSYCACLLKSHDAVTQSQIRQYIILKSGDGVIKDSRDSMDWSKPKVINIANNNIICVQI
jgi:hypothetical protein